MNRTAVAFALAPLWVPVLMAPLAGHVIFPYPEQAHWVGTAIFLAAIFGYCGAYLFGFPAFCFLRARGLTAWWISVVLGFAIAVIVLAIFAGLFALLLGASMLDAMFGSLRIFYWEGTGVVGLAGSLVGITLWLIARPDRTQCGEPQRHPSL